jgi:hypothetical protein
MYDSNTQWFSQALFTYKDKIYATEGYLRISISTNSSEELNYFNPPVINISITNNYQKSINLNIQSAKDLIKAFKLILPQINGKELSIQRKYQKDTVLHFTFKLDSDEQRVVVIEIRNNESDFTKIVVPLEGVFETFASCIREFTENYMTMCTQLLIQSIQSRNTQVIQQLPALIKGISSQIISSDSRGSIESPDSRAPEREEKGFATETESIINDFDKFLDENIDKVVIPEIERAEGTEKKSVMKVDSIFVERYLQKNLSNLESTMVNCFMSDSPFVNFIDDIKSKIMPYVKDENFSLLPDITDHDFKSFVYISKLMCSMTYHDHVNLGQPIPSSAPVFKYAPSNFDPLNLEIAYDLFLFNLYIRTVRRRLENVISDPMRSKALFYMQMRCYTDPLVFSFIEKVDNTKLASIISNRYEYYDSIGVFDEYKVLLEEINAPDVKKSDIQSVVQEAVDKIIGKGYKINEIHENMYQQNFVKLESKNNYNLEQIINEILPLEISEKSGKSLKDDSVIEELRINHNISDEILSIFVKEKKKVKKEKVEHGNNLLRVIKSQFIKEVPEQYRDDFIKYLSEFDNKKFDINDKTFPIEEFGDNVIKALYLWDPEKDDIIKKSYKEFFLKVENELMERDLILSKIKIKEETDVPKESSDWDFIITE